MQTKFIASVRAFKWLFASVGLCSGLLGAAVAQTPQLLQGPRAGAVAGNASVSPSGPGQSSSGAESVGGMATPVVYMANQEYPEQIIRNVAYSAGMSLGSGNSERSRRSLVTGRLAAASLSDLLTQLGRNHGFEYFMHGATIYLYDSSDWRTETIYLGFRPDDAFRDNLSAYGLLNPRFKLLPRPEQESVVVTAPRQYIAILERTLKTERDQNPTEMMVFRLKYAAVDDRVMTLRDRQVVTPGVASLLRGILFGQSSGRQSPAAASGAGGAAGMSPAAALGGASPALMPGLPALQSMPSLGGMSDGTDNGSPSGGGSRGGASDAAPMAAPGAAGAAQINVTVQADVRTNAIIIRDRPSREPAYRKLISLLDVPLDMVEIEAVLIDIDQRRLDELGVQWSASTRTLRADFPGSQTLGVFGVDGSTAVVADRSRFVARLQALIADNDAKVLAKPTILTLDNLSGVIDLTQTFYTRVQGERVANVVPVVAGSLLRVSPRIVRDTSGLRPTEVLLQVEIEDGSLKDRAGLDLPTVQKNAISTQASILTDQAILIGGYTRESEEQTTFKVPLLGDLPYIGALMRSRSTNVQKMTRLFLITPRIVSGGQGGTPLEAQVKDRLDRGAAQRMEVLLPKSATAFGRMSTELAQPARGPNQN